MIIDIKESNWDKKVKLNIARNKQVKNIWKKKVYLLRLCIIL